MALLPKNYQCPCGANHFFPAWVYAHWDDTITHRCEECDAMNDLEHGILIGKDDESQERFRKADARRAKRRERKGFREPTIPSTEGSVEEEVRPEKG